LRHMHTGAAPDRTEMTAALGREVEAQLKRLAEAFPARHRTELVELAALAARNLKSEASDSPILACAGLTALPAPEVKPLLQWRGIAALLITKDAKGAWRKRFDKTIGFPQEERDGKTRMTELLQRLAEQPGLLRLLVATAKLPEPVYADAQWQVLLA